MFSKFIILLFLYLGFISGCKNEMLLKDRAYQELTGAFDDNDSPGNCTNGALNFPDCDMCPPNFMFEHGRCVCHNDPVFCPAQALCQNGGGAGRKIIAILEYLGEGYPEDLEQDFAEIKASTGIDIVAFRYDSQANVDAALNAFSQDDYDAIWYMGHNLYTQYMQQTLPVIESKISKGIGLILFADNDPFGTGANSLMQDLFPDWNMKISGNFVGRGVVSKAGYVSDGLGLLHDHPVTSGLYQSVSEGITISWLSKFNVNQSSIMDSPSFSPIITNTQGNISAASVEEELLNQTNAYLRARKNASGKYIQRTILHGGFTSLFRRGSSSTWGWEASNSPGTPQFFTNMACWSAGAD